MPDSKAAAKCGSEKSLPENIEKDSVGLPAADEDNLRHEKSRPAVTATGDRFLVLMDLENGMVGWDCAEDPDNPQ